MPNAALQAALVRAMPHPTWARDPLPGVAVALLLGTDWEHWLDDACRVLDGAERTRVGLQRREPNRRSLTTAYAVHRILLALALGCEPANVPLYRDVLGCPRIQGGRIHTSLSHADDHIAVAISTVGPVGVDIEPLTRAASMAEISGHVCHPEEAAAISTMHPSRRAEALLGIWVRKEAVLKAAGVGMAQDMNGFPAHADHVLPMPSRPADRTVVRMIDSGPSCLAAVASPPAAPLRTTWLRPGPT